jgi:hypothetical protein
MRTRKIAYWAATVLIAFSMGSGGIGQLARVPGVVDGFVRLLGYPAYFVTILGFWKVLGAIAILVPGFPRLKEWAYAGIFFDLTGAAASSAAVRAQAFHVIVPLVLTAVLMVSSALRPESRTIAKMIPGRRADTELNPTAAKIA